VLKLLGFQPYHGATQILPRILFKPLASAIKGISEVLSKIATDIRLGARSASVLYQEPFAPRQMGSSAGPQKRNTINTEQEVGMEALASGFELAISQVVKTWEERDISQSCVERIAWRDLFHASIRQITVMTKVIDGLVVYPDNMMAEIVKTNGCYAASVAKERLRKLAVPFGLTAEDCYRIVQLAAFDLGYPELDSRVSQSLDEAQKSLEAQWIVSSIPVAPDSIRDVIEQARLEVCEILAPTTDEVEGWNKTLRDIFLDPDNRNTWHEVFSLAYLLRHEYVIFEQLFGKEQKA